MNQREQAIYKKYPQDIVDAAFKKFPVKSEYIPDIDEGCPGTWDEDVDFKLRHCYILGRVDERNAHLK